MGWAERQGERDGGGGVEERRTIFQISGLGVYTPTDDGELDLL